MQTSVTLSKERVFERELTLSGIIATIFQSKRERCYSAHFDERQYDHIIGHVLQNKTVQPASQCVCDLEKVGLLDIISGV